MLHNRLDVEWKEVEGALTLHVSKVSNLGDWDGEDRKRNRLDKKDDEFRFGHIVCDVAVRYPTKDDNRFSEV